MKFFKVLDSIKKKQSSLFIYCMLDRIPIIVFGDDEVKTDDFLMEMTDLVHFRKEVVFYSDFISLNEYDILIQNENIDYNSQRCHIRCPCNVALKALNQFEKFNSWIIGIEIPQVKERVRQFINSIKKKIILFLSISLFSNSVSVELIGLNWKLLDLTFERDVLHKISQDTERSIIKMKRTLLGKVKTEQIDDDLVKTLLDFDVEKEELKRNIFKKEIQNFYSGSKRAFFIFSRLNLLNNIDMNTKIGSKTLQETIDYYDAPIERIVSFVNKEWGEDFSLLIENGKKVNVLDSMQSLWG